MTLHKLSGILKSLKQKVHFLLINRIVGLILLAAADVLMQNMSGFEEKQLNVNYITLQFLYLFAELGHVSLQSLVFAHLLSELRL